MNFLEIFLMRKTVWHDDNVPVIPFPTPPNINFQILPQPHTPTTSSPHNAFFSLNKK